MRTLSPRFAAGVAAAALFLVPALPARALPPRVIEVAVVVDHALFVAKGADTVPFVERLVASTNTVYSAELGTQVRLASVAVMEVADPWPVTPVGLEVDYMSLLDDFSAWQQMVLPGQRDVAVLLSGLDFQGSVAGLAWVSAMCQPSNGAAIVEARVASEAAIAVTLQHEIGHSLGMQHDSTGNVCPSSGFIMAAVGCPGCSSQPTQFSSCSDAYFANWLAGTVTTCLWEYCGSGELDAGEACDDGNIDGGDCCDETCQFEPSLSWCGDGEPDPCGVSARCDGAGTCMYLPPPICSDGNPCTQDTCVSGSGCQYPAAPATGCVTGAKASLKLSRNEADASKNKLKWKLSGGGLVEQVGLGNPAASGSWTMCVYDQAASSATLESTLVVGPGVAWQDNDPKGWSYLDKAGLQAGVTKMQLVPGADGKSSASLQASGVSLPMPSPVDASTYFAADPGVIVQLRSDDVPVCWSSEFPTAKANDGTKYKAVVKP